MPTENTPQQAPSHSLRTAILLISLALVLGVVLFWQTVHTSSERVFWGMVGNNLSTEGFTRTVSSDYQGQKYEKATLVGFGKAPYTQSVEQITQKQNDNKSEVIAEYIGTLKADYNRYIKIETNEKSKDGQVLNASQIVGTWGKNDVPNTVSGYAQAVQGLVAFADLPTMVRNDVVKRIKDTNVYSVDFSAAKPRKEGNKSAWTYDVQVDVYKFLQVLQLVSQYNGLQKDFIIDPEQFKDQGKLQITMVIDKASHQLLSIEQQGQVQRYSGYGLRKSPELPTQTISQQEFESKLQTLQ